jgi:UDP-glucuronate 4-epimerase
MRILLTGAAGFIGSHVAEALLGRGDEVVGLDNFDDGYDPDRKERNVAELERWPGWVLVRGDALDRQLVQRVCTVDDIEAVVHLAARCGLVQARREPERHCEVNVTGTASVLEAAHRAGVSRFVLASSASVYGGEPAPQSTATPTARPLSVHAATRRSAELLCAAFAERERLNATVLRLFSVYGPRQRPDGAVQTFLEALEQGRKVKRRGDGSQQRDLVHVEDVAAAFARALDHAAEREPGHRIFNVGGGVGTSVSELLAAVEKACGRTAQVEEVREAPGESRALVADADETRRELGWQARISLEDGLRTQLDWHRMLDESPPKTVVSDARSDEEAP